jgi:hypothetical protein
VNLDSSDDSCCPVEDHPQGDGPYFHAPTATEYVRADLAPQWQDKSTAPDDGTVFDAWCVVDNGKQYVIIDSERWSDRLQQSLNAVENCIRGE